MVLSEWRGLGRFCRRHWMSTSAAMLVVGVAVSLSAVTFELADAGVWRALPYREPADLAVLTTHSDSGEARVSMPDFLAVRARLPEVRVAAAGGFVPEVALTGFGEPRSLKSRVLSAGYFATLGVTPVAGRDFTPAEERPGAHAVVIITDRLWQELFGRRAGVVGESLTLNGRTYAIVGVLPPMRDYLGAVDLYTPLQFPPSLPRRLRLLEPIVRVPAGEDEALRTAIAAVTAAPDDPDARGHVVRVVRLAERISAGAKGRLLALFSAGLALLVIAIANTSALVVSRTRQRASELALRRALGASARATLTVAAMDAAALVVGGAAIAVVLSAWSLPLVAATWGAGLVNGVSLGGRVLLWVGLAGSALLAASTLAIIRTIDATDQASLRSWRRRSVGRLAVIGQLALATGLVAVAVTLTRHVKSMAMVDPGFRVHARYTSRISLPAAQYPTARDRERFWDTLVRALHERGVDAAITSELPLTGEDNPTAFVATTSGGDEFVVKVRSTSPEYLAFMRIPLMEGRYLTANDDRASARAIVVNRSMARLLGATGPALGQGLSFDFGEGPRPATVVGIVGDIRHAALNRPADPEVYFSARQTPLTAYSLVLSGDSRTTRVREVLVDVLRALDAGRPFMPLTAYGDVIARTLSAPRLDAQLITLAALAATLVATTGLYALLSLLVTGAAREWAIRLAIGASPRQLRQSLVGRMLLDLGCGVLVGVGLAWALGSSLESAVPGARVRGDLGGLALTVGLMVAACAAATLAPALRIGRIAPADVLRA